MAQLIHEPRPAPLIQHSMSTVQQRSQQKQESCIHVPRLLIRIGRLLSPRMQRYTPPPIPGASNKQIEPLSEKCGTTQHLVSSEICKGRKESAYSSSRVETPDIPASRRARATPSNDGHPQITGIIDLSGKVKKIKDYPIYSGAYSRVYLGRYNNEKVAVKAIQPANSVHVTRRKIRREAETWWQLSHPNILPLYGMIETEEFGIFGALVSPWCIHGNAGEFMPKNSTPSNSIRIFQEISNGLQYLHDFQPTIVHGDLKPANVLVDEHHKAKICDFGLVRLVHNEASSGLTTTSTHTGTTRYLAYEVLVLSDLPSTASDVHALACLGMEFIYQQPPYVNIRAGQANAAYSIYRAVSDGIPPASRPRGIDESISTLWDLFERCWDIHPEKRPNASTICDYLNRNGSDLVKSLTPRETRGIIQ